MPGMMDTVLNVGLNAKTVEAHRVKKNDNQHYVCDTVCVYIYTIYIYIIYIYINK